jgi:hypothetical protein
MRHPLLVGLRDQLQRASSLQLVGMVQTSKRDAIHGLAAYFSCQRAIKAGSRLTRRIPIAFRRALARLKFEINKILKLGYRFKTMNLRKNRISETLFSKEELVSQK